MSLAIFLLLVLASLGRFADFLLGKRGQRHVKDRLVEWYVRLAGSDWADLLRAAASLVDGFLSRVLGEKVLSRRSIVRLFGLSVVLDVLILVTAFSVQNGSLIAGVSFFTRTTFWWATVSILVCNAVVDALSFAASRAAYRRLTTFRSHALIAVVVATDVALTYLAVALSVLLTVPTVITGLTASEPALPPVWVMWPRRFLAQLRESFLHPWDANMTIGDLNFSLFAASAAIPTALHLLIFAGLMIARLSRPVTQRPLTLMLERLEEAPSGTFTTIGVGLGALAAIVAAFSKVVE